MADTDRIAATAARHDLSRDAVQVLADALQAGRGGGAQWSHADLGGMGQWTRSGMLQIGDMFNNDLKARIGAALDDLVRQEAGARSTETPSSEGASPRSGSWWPSDLGSPSSTGAQNAMRYACFPDKKRLVVERDGRAILYDTGELRLTGVSQAQSVAQTLEFSGPDGRVTLDDLRVIA